MRLPKFGDPHNLSSPPSERQIIVQEKPERPSLRDGEGSARVGDDFPIWVARGDLGYNIAVTRKWGVVVRERLEC